MGRKQGNGAAIGEPQVATVTGGVETRRVERQAERDDGGIRKALAGATVTFECLRPETPGRLVFEDIGPRAMRKRLSCNVHRIRFNMLPGRISVPRPAF